MEMFLSTEREPQLLPDCLEGLGESVFLSVTLLGHHYAVPYVIVYSVQIQEF